VLALVVGVFPRRKEKEVLTLVSARRAVAMRKLEVGRMPGFWNGNFDQNERRPECNFSEGTM